MNVVPLHPALVHVPLGIAFVAPLVAVALAVAVWRAWLPARIFALLAGLQAVALAAGSFALREGHEEEERVEKQVSERLLEEHQESAERFLWATGAALLCSAGIVFLRDPRTARWAAVASVTTALAAAGLGIAAGKTGGEVAYGGGVAGVVSPATSDRERERDDE